MNAMIIAPKSRRNTALALIAVALIGVNACSDNDGPAGYDPTGRVARVRFVNATPDTAQANAISVRVDSVPVSPPFGGLAYRAATAYVPAYLGTRRLLVSKSATSTGIVAQDLALADSGDYTVLLAGPVGSAISPVVLRDNNAPPAAGSIKLRFVNAAPSTAALDVYVTAATTDLATVSPTVARLAPNEASAYFEPAAASYRVRFTTAGTKTVVLDVPAAIYAAGQIRTIIAFDKPGGGSPLASTVLVDRNP